MFYLTHPDRWPTKEQPPAVCRGVWWCFVGGVRTSKITIPLIRVCMMSFAHEVTDLTHAP